MLLQPGPNVLSSDAIIAGIDNILHTIENRKPQDVKVELVSLEMDSMIQREVFRHRRSELWEERQFKHQMKSTVVKACLARNPRATTHDSPVRTQDEASAADQDRIMPSAITLASAPPMDRQDKPTELDSAIATIEALHQDNLSLEHSVDDLRAGLGALKLQHAEVLQFEDALNQQVIGFSAELKQLKDEYGIDMKAETARVLSLQADVAERRQLCEKHESDIFAHLNVVRDLTRRITTIKTALKQSKNEQKQLAEHNEYLMKENQRLKEVNARLRHTPSDLPAWMKPSPGS